MAVTRASLLLLAVLASGASEDPAPPDDHGPRGTRAATKLGVYTDDDGLTVVTPVVSFKQRIYDTTTLGLAYDADILTAATVDVRTAASNRFTEIRHGLALSGGHRFLEQELQLDGALALSRENDYRSLTASVSAAQDLLDRNLTLGAGYAFVANGVGRSGTPSSSFLETLWIHALSASVTQLLSRESFVQVAASFIVADGYQASVYRYVPVFLEGTTGANVLNEDTLRSGAAHPLLQLAESLPADRYRFAGLVRLNYYLESLAAAVEADYRYYLDSWQVRSHTLDVHVFKELAFGLELRLGNRLYAQSGAEFFRTAYVVSDPDARPEFYTVDRELGSFWYEMPGVKLVWRTGPSGPLEGFSLDLKVDVQYTRYSNFAFLLDRTALVTQLGAAFDL